MSHNYSTIFSRLVMSCCAVLCIATMGTITPAFAQHGVNGTAPVEGVPDIYVNASGSRVGGFGESACPFADMDMGKLQAAFEAAKGKDPDSCPHANSPILNRKIYFRSCAGVYSAVARQVTTLKDPTLNVNIACCHMKPGPARDNCRTAMIGAEAMTKAYAGQLSRVLSVPPLGQGVWSTEDVKELAKKQQEKADADKQCFEDSFNRIEEYWAQKRGVSCIRYVSRAIKAFVKDGMRGLRSSMLEQTTTGGGSTMTYGALTAVFSAPSIWGLGGTIAAAVNFASDAISVASEASDMLNTLSDQCGNVIPALRQIQEWRKTVLGLNLCQAAENLLERQLTQCIRVNLDASSALRLPQFSVMLQCPVNINIGMRLSPRGFDCYASGSVGSPIVASTGRRSLLSGNGGLENLFNGECFTSPTSRPESGVPNGGMGQGGTGQGGVGDGTGGVTRTPGVDCGPLDPSPAKQVNIKGLQVLGQGRTTNGWAVGGSETVNGQRVTRCDFYDAGRAVRSAFVYGDGASCRSQEGGFMSGGYETNTSCYGGYTPASAPNIPDACMYDVGCLDANGNFDINRAGTSSCTTSVPQFDATRTYNTFVQGGVSGGGGGNLGRPCSDFDNVDPDAWKASLCCDPQKQDCRQRDANMPLCACDEGDAFNRVKVDLATNAPDALGRCEQGGKKTCCSPRINGGKEACAMMGMEICEAEKADQCVPTDSRVTFTGPDGVTRTNYTAAQVAQSKPSPYMYLFVRPDVTMPNGQQCCTTEWCNVCPQHYANAYGLSLKRDSAYLMPQSDADNRNIIGRGWPFAIKEGPEPTGDGSNINLDADTEYAIGVQELQRLWVQAVILGNERELSIAANKVPLYLSESMKLPASLATCNNLGYLKAKTVPSDMFRGDGSGMNNYGMGFAFNAMFAHRKKSPVWIVHAGIPEPMEYPMDYLNRLRRGITDAEGTPLPPITLCNDVKICTPESSGTVIQPSGGSGTGMTVGSPTFSGPTRSGMLDTVAPIATPSLGTISLQQGFSNSGGTQAPNPTYSTGPVGSGNPASLSSVRSSGPVSSGGIPTTGGPRTSGSAASLSGQAGASVVAPAQPTTGGPRSAAGNAASLQQQQQMNTPRPTTVPSAGNASQQGTRSSNGSASGSSSSKAIGLY